MESPGFKEEVTTFTQQLSIPASKANGARSKFSEKELPSSNLLNDTDKSYGPLVQART